MPNPFKILILGGTRNARDIAISLADNPLFDVITSLAGRTSEPDRSFGNTRIGGFGGAEGLAEYIAENNVNLLVDATHPFAIAISNNAVKAEKIAGIPRLVFSRPQWERKAGDNWTECENIEQAARILESGSTAFLALGHQYLDAFASRKDICFIARMIDPPKTPIALANHTLVIAKPSHLADEEAALFEHHKVSHLVCRNSGGDLIYAKIEAARSLELPVFMIKRPAPPPGPSYCDISALKAQIIRLAS